MVDPRERVIRVPARTTLSVLAVALSLIGLLTVIWLARQVLTWILIALFLALAINPYVDFLQRRVVRRRGLAAALGFGTVIVLIVGLAAAFVPTIVGEVGDFVDALPGYVGDLTEGRGRLGFLETRYHIVERVQDAVKGLKPESVLAASGTALAVTKGIITAVVGVITIVVLTFFMLLEGPSWIERGLGHLPSGSQERWQRIARDVYKTVGGYVSGALIIAFVAGASSTIVLSIAGVPYAFALGLLTFLLDLIPLVGATSATVIVGTIALPPLRAGRDRRGRLLHPLPAVREPRALPDRLLAHGRALAAGRADRGADRRFAGRHPGRDRGHSGRGDRPGAPARLARVTPRSAPRAGGAGRGAVGPAAAQDPPKGP